MLKYGLIFAVVFFIVYMVIKKTKDGKESSSASGGGASVGGGGANSGPAVNLRPRVTASATARNPKPSVNKGGGAVDLSFKEEIGGALPVGGYYMRMLTNDGQVKATRV